MTPRRELPDGLTDFLLCVSRVGLDDATTMLRNAVLANGGLWLDDDSASHLFEIELFGIWTTGATAREAARNWIKCANTACEFAIGGPFRDPQTTRGQARQARAQGVDTSTLGGDFVSEITPRFTDIKPEDTP